MKTPCFFPVGSSVRFALIIALLLLGSATGYAAGTTARVALERAMESGQQWQTDAVLTSVYAATADVDGKCPAWAYGFYSPKAAKFLNVTIRGRAVETLEIAVGQKEAVPADFLDSDLAMAEARTAGIQADSMRMRLTKTEWLVNGGDQKGAKTVWLNPRSGKLIKTTTVQ